MISVIVGVFGDERWDELAAKAANSAKNQCDNVIISRSNTLAKARNEGVLRSTEEWLCFLDADDELDVGYIAAMSKQIAALDNNKALLQPATLGIVDGVEDAAPYMIPKKNLLDGNHMVIGTLISREVFEEVGGFAEWPMYEDWDLWIRAVLVAQCEIFQVHDAIYRVNVSSGRNSQDRRLQVDTYQKIRSQYV